MVKFTCLEGYNKKYYIQCIPETQADLQTIKLIEGIVSRSEYKPFSKGFDKNIKQNYWIDNTFVPAQFLQNIKKELQPVLNYPIVFHNQNILFNTELTKSDYVDYIETLTLPEKYDIFKEEYWHQMESVYRVLLLKTGRIEVGTAGGKTLITYLYCRFMIDNIISKLPEKKKVLIIVPRQLLAKQTQKDFMEYDANNDKPLLVETIYSGSKRIANAQIVIGVYNSLSEYDAEYFDDFHAIICDEVQSAKTYSIRNGIYAKCRKTEYWFGCTGSYPKHHTLDYLNIVSMFGPLVLIKKTWELIEDGNATPVFINKIRINYTEENSNFSTNLLESGFTGSEKYRIEKKFFQTYQPRNAVIAKLINAHPYNHIVLVESVEYCKSLQEYFLEFCPNFHCEIIHGNVNNRDEIIIDTKGRNDVIIVATYETMSTGVSINNLHHLHFPDGGRSEIRIKQSCGRILRLDDLKILANVWDYQDQMKKSSYLVHANERNKIYVEEKFPSKEYNTTI